MVFTYKLEYTPLQIEIFRLLCIKAGEKLNQRQIAILLKVTPRAVAKSLPLLSKRGLIQVVESNTMNLKQIQFNSSVSKTVRLKRLENLRMIYESSIVDDLEASFPGCAIILFGSFSRGEDTTKSDIDIAIIGAKEKKTNFLALEKAFLRPIRLSFYESLGKIKKELKENICNGIVLSGGIEL